MKTPVPAWVGSLIFHGLGLLLLMLLIRDQPPVRGAPGVEGVNSVGIVLKTESSDGAVYQNKTEIFEPKPSDTTTTKTAAEIAQTLPESTEFDPSSVLPKPMDIVIGATSVASGIAGESKDRTDITAGAAAGGHGKGSGVAAGSAATIGVFGLQGTGHRFAFVFDRSGSMTEKGGKPIQAAKAELIRALDSLKSVHQILIVFYNEAPSVYPSGEQSGKLIFATDDNKEAAKRFIRSIVPDGGTDHEKALVLAAKQRPDVIFLLTDGLTKDDLSVPQMERISKVSGGIQINVIQFGIGPEPGSRRNYLKLLAGQNDGLYQYIDISTL